MSSLSAARMVGSNTSCRRFAPMPTGNRFALNDSKTLCSVLAALTNLVDLNLEGTPTSLDANDRRLVDPLSVTFLTRGLGLCGIALTVRDQHRRSERSGSAANFTSLVATHVTEPIQFVLLYARLWCGRRRRAIGNTF